MRKTTLTTTLLLLLIFPVFAQNNALQFDGTNAVNCGTAATVNITGTSLTLEAWIYPTTFATNYWEGSIVAKDGESIITGYTLRCGGTGRLSFVFAVAPDTWTEVLTGNNALELNKWQHVAGVYNGTTMKIYIDGKEIASTNENRAILASAIYPLTIGASPGAWAPARRFIGRIDEVRVWTSARTEAEIKANMFKTINSNANLIASYDFNEGNGTSLTDLSGNNNNGTLSNAPIWKSAGCFAGARNALDFDGVDDFIDLPAGLNTLLDNAQQFSIMGWVKANNARQWNSVFQKYIDVSNRISLQMSGPGSGETNDFIMSVNGNYAWTTTDGLELNKWVHVAMVYDGSLTGNDQRLKCYVNGVLQTLSFSGTIPSNIITGGSLQLGKEGLQTSNQWQGMMDEFSIWTIAISGATIRESITKNLVGNEAGLAAYYRFDLKDGSTLYDLSSNAYHGTLTNMDPATDWVNSAAFNQWIGSESAAWNTALNWSTGTTPVATDNIGLYKNNLGSECSITGSPTINHILFSSTAAPTLGSAITVNGSLLLNRNLDLNGQTITLGSSGILEEGNDRVFGLTGSITTTRSLSNINGLNVGGLGAIITTAANMGSTTITRKHAAQQLSILRYYDISPTTNTGLNATLVFTYNENELNGLTETDLGLFKSTDAGVSWLTQNGTLNTAANTISLSGIDGFSRWTAANRNVVLPLSFLSFTASATSEAVVLRWTTAVEINTKDFLVQHSSDGSNWHVVGIIPAASNSIAEQSYRFVHSNPANGINYYRLQQRDINEKYSWSKINTIVFTKTQKAIRIFPNPVVNGLLNIHTETAGLLELFDNNGKRVFQTSVTSGTQQIQLKQIPSGMYQLKIGNEHIQVFIQ